MTETTETPAGIDLAQLLSDVEGSKMVTSTDARGAIIDRAGALCLIDIAVSLRELAGYVNLAATPAQWATGATEPETPPELPLDVGDYVSVDGLDTDVVAKITDLATGEGRSYAVIEWPGGDTNKAWLDMLTRAVMAEPEPPPKGKKKGRENE